MQWEKQKGFTIVELLIVIVVIAILAAITIVSYNGIQNRAKSVAIQANARESGQKVALYSLSNNSLYPDEASYRSALNLPATDTSQATYDYIISDDQKSFCLSVSDTTTSPVTSFAYTSTSNGVVDGRCVKNLAVVPSLEGGVSTGWSSGWAAGTGISATASVPSDGGYAGTAYRRWNIGGSNTTNGAAYLGNTVATSGASKLAVSFWIRSSAASSLGIQLNKFTAADGTGTSTSATANIVAVSPLDTWVRRAGAMTIDAGINSARLILRATTGTLVAGQTVDADAVMIVLGDVDYRYYDGDSPNWAWTGAPNNSPSFGPALPY